jgi:hypothetical protein
MKNDMPDAPCALEDAGDMPVQPATMMAIDAATPYVSRVICQFSWVGQRAPREKPFGLCVNTGPAHDIPGERAVVAVLP